MPLPTLQHLRIQANRLHHTLGGRHWFPHVPLALMLALGGIWLLKVDLGPTWTPFLDSILAGHPTLTPAILPPLLIGLGLLTMATGLLFRSRLAWLMALLLTATATISLIFRNHDGSGLLVAYFTLLITLLAFAWREFRRASIAASTLFALTSVVMLLLYATFGAYYLGSSFKPEIQDLTTALYFAMVTMTTVGYGDISPQTAEARLFTVSVIILGVAVFATSLTAVIAPMVSNSLKQIVNRQGARMKRENHFVVLGDSPLAVNTVRELSTRGQAVTRVLRRAPEDGSSLTGVDHVLGDPGSVDVLREAGAAKATAVMAMLGDDSENAFAVLAARELGGRAKTVAAVNDARHLSRIKLVQPDVIIAPQILGGELAAMLMCGEEVTSDFVIQRVFQSSQNDSKPQ